MIRYLIAAIAALVILLGIQTHRLDNAQTDHADYVAGIADQAQEASEKARQTEQQRQRDIEQVRTDAANQKIIDDAHAAELLAAGDSLREQQTKLLADRAALRARLTARGKTIDDLTDLLAQLRTEADSHAGELAVALDASRRAGFACESAYDAMRASK
jgi:septal ring factor EnvC (AmiA/AmiB activator)